MNDSRQSLLSSLPGSLRTNNPEVGYLEGFGFIRPQFTLREKPGERRTKPCSLPYELTERGRDFLVYLNGGSCVGGTFNVARGAWEKHVLQP